MTKKKKTNKWNDIYLTNPQPGWDIGYCSTPLKEYFDQLEDKELKILIPGAGNAYEVEYLFQKVFKNVYLLDFAEKPITTFLERVPEFPENHIIIEDFFEHQGKYDLIIEQTFFSSIPRNTRFKYVCQTHNLLNDNGRLVGLLFNHEFDFDHQPFGGSESEYISLFRPCFNFRYFETAYNSIKPRTKREIFMFLRKKEVFCRVNKTN